MQGVETLPTCYIYNLVTFILFGCSKRMVFPFIFGLHVFCPFTAILSFNCVNVSQRNYVLFSYYLFAKRGDVMYIYGLP